MKNNLVNLKKIEKMACLALKNGLRLHNDSILLFKNRCYPSAYFLSILALEEIGKFFLLEDFWWHSKIDRRMDKKTEEEFIELIYMHRSKQNSFAYNTDGPFPISIFAKSLFNGDMEIKKQNAVYVGLPRNKRKINTKGKINNPIDISKSKSSNQITNVNDKLILFTLGVAKQVYCVETECTEKILNKNLYKQLRKRWSIVKTTTKRKLQELEQI